MMPAEKIAGIIEFAYGGVRKDGRWGYARDEAAQVVWVGVAVSWDVHQRARG